MGDGDGWQLAARLDLLDLLERERHGGVRKGRSASEVGQIERCKNGKKGTRYQK